MNLQGSVNQTINTVGGAISVAKHLQQQQTQIKVKEAEQQQQAQRQKDLANQSIAIRNTEYALQQLSPEIKQSKNDIKETEKSLNNMKDFVKMTNSGNVDMRTKMGRQYSNISMDLQKKQQSLQGLLDSQKAYKQQVIQLKNTFDLMKGGVEQ